MRSFTNLLIAMTALALAACGDRADVAPSAKPAAGASVQAVGPAYAATLGDGIAFARPGYPEFVARTEGISQPEPFGRWTEGPKAAIEFKEPLPKKFELVVQGAAFGPNIGQPVKVTIGGITREFSFPADLGHDAQTRRLPFDLDQPATRIEFAIPHATRPTNGDVRELGIALVALKIEAASN